MRDKVFLKVAPMKGVMRFGRNEKLSLCVNKPFGFFERIDPMA